MPSHSFPRRNLSFTALIFLWVLAAFNPRVVADEFLLKPDMESEDLAKKISAGDEIVLTNGTWKDADLKFERLPGTERAPVVIRPQTPGSVVFTGTVNFRFSGTYVIVRDFVFRDTVGASDVVQLRTHSKRHAHNSRFTNCVFEQSPTAEVGIESRWLSVFGTHNRIDHCYFSGKRSRGTTMVVWVVEAPELHRIDHNHFGPRPELGRNGGETIRIGTSEVSEFESGCVVEDNYFHACDGEAEIVSNKSCGNTYRRNWFENCAGALTMRHGHKCLITDNVFRGHQKSGTGGVRIIGRSHRVIGNYFEGLRGDGSRASVCLMNGIPNYSLNSYAPVIQAELRDNTFVDCKVNIEMGYKAGKKQSAAPTRCVFENNAFLPVKWPVFRLHAEPVDATWNNNKHDLGSRVRDNEYINFERADLKFERSSDELLRPTAASPRNLGFRSRTQDWPTPENCGPKWYSPDQRSDEQKVRAGK